MTVRRGLIRDIRAALAAAADPAVAEPMRAYMKSEMPCHGVKKTPRVAALRPVFEARPLDGWEDLRDTTLALWNGAKFREERYAALDLTRRREHRAHLTVDAVPMYQEMIVTGAWWDLVDEIATHRIGTILDGSPKLMTKRMRRWSRSNDMWIARTAILSQIRRKGRTDRKLLASCCEPSIESKEFFLRKAIGWALRELSKTDPEWVRAYVDKHEQRLSGLSKREALKRIR